MPKSSRIRKGPSSRLSTSRGWRRTSLTSLLKNESRRMNGLNMSLFRLRLLHELNKNVVERRHILIGLLDRDVRMLLHDVEDDRQTSCGVVDIQVEQAGLAARAPHIVDGRVALEDLCSVQRVRRIDNQLDHLAAERPTPQVLRRIDMEQTSCAHHADHITVGRLAYILRRHEQRAALVAQRAEVLPELGAQYRVDSRGRLVGKDQQRVVSQRAGQLQAPLHTAGELAAEPALDIAQLHKIERLLQALPPAEVAHSVQRSHEIQILPDREVWV